MTVMTYKALQNVHERKTLSINSVLTQRVIVSGEQVDVEEIRRVGQNEYLKLVGGGWVISKFGNSKNSLVPVLPKTSVKPQKTEPAPEPEPESDEEKPVVVKGKGKKSKSK